MSTHSAMSAAFELLREEVDSQMSRVNQEGGEAFVAGDHAKAQAALKRATELDAIHQQLDELEERYPIWLRTASAGAEGGTKLLRGLKTPESAYRLPILRALVELGGKGSIDAVLERVYAALKGSLNEYDLAALPSDEDMPRWRNTAQWARNSLRAEGLLRADSPRGIWEITEEGRRAAAGAG